MGMASESNCLYLQRRDGRSHREALSPAWWE